MTRRLKFLLLFAFLIAVLAGFFRSTVERLVATSLLLHQESPNESNVLELFRSNEDSIPLLERFWSSDKIPHRYLVTKYLSLPESRRFDDSPEIERILSEAVLDIDFNVRELALTALEQGAAQDFPEQLMNQLRDSDPHLRIKALQYLRQNSEASRMADVIALLDDPEPSVVATAAGLLRLWTNNDFGIRNRDAIAKVTEQGLHLVPEEALARIRNGVSAWKTWWSNESERFPPATVPNEMIPPATLPTEDFELEDLDGNFVRLSDFRGKTVLLNFWATWCTACVMEMPDLVELDARFDDDFVILGISLDGDDGHGHGHEHAAIVDHEEAQEHGWDAVDGRQDSESSEHDHDHLGERGKEIKSKIVGRIRRTVRRKGLTYQILLDPVQRIGSRFNGHELPTNVLIDKDGFVRRRFIGSRPLTAWEAMIREIQ